MLKIRQPLAEEVWRALKGYLEGRDLDDREIWLLGQLD